MVMSFDCFHDSASWCDDLGARLCDASWDDEVPHKGVGNVYIDALFIERVQDHWPENVRCLGAWHLLIGRESWTSDDLNALERRLYEYAVSEGYCEDVI